MFQEKIDYRIAINETSIIKGIAIAAMLWHHLFLNRAEFGTTVCHLASVCKVCVALFVFLSGYGMTIGFRNIKHGDSISEKTAVLLKFLIRRYIKFFLNYWSVFVVVVPLGVFVFGRTLQMAYGNDLTIGLIRDIFGLQGFDSYNITWWFNRIILFLWLLFPLFYWSMKSKIVSGWMLLLLLLNPGDILWPLHFVADGLPFYMVDYALGVFIALNIEFISKFLNKFNSSLVLITSFFVMTLFLLLRNVEIIPNFSGYTVDPFIAFFLTQTVVCFCRLSKFKLKILPFVGKHSMNIYLIHTFIFGYFFHDLVYSFNNPILIFIVLLMISLILSICLEKIKTKLKFYKLQHEICFLVKTFNSESQNTYI